MKRFIYILCGYSIFFSAFALVLYHYHTADRSSYIDGHLKVLESRIDATKKNMGIFSQFVFESSINKPEVTSLINTAWEGDADKIAEQREALRRLMFPVYQQLLNYDYRQLHFHFPDSVSFLRMHSPDNFGDSLYAIRPTVRLTNEQLKPVVGFEEGRIFNGYRFVYPLFHEGQHCGSVEVSFSMGSFIRILSGSDNSNIVFAIKRSVVENTVFKQQQDNYTLSPFSDDYMLDSHLQNAPTNPILVDQLKPRIAEKLKSDNDFGVVLSQEGQDRLILFKAIRNLNNDTAGYLIMATNDTGYALLRTGYQLALAIAALALLVATMLTERVLVERDRLKSMASTDQLTGLANRHHFLEVSTNELMRARRYGLSVAMIIFDIDHFKAFNDSFGHNEGDRAIQGVAQTVSVTIRKTDTLGRWGGEEFAVLLPFCDEATAYLVADKLRLAVCDSVISTKRKVTISVGVAAFNGSENLESLIGRADSAMYKAKARGRNCVACFDAKD